MASRFVDFGAVADSLSPVSGVGVAGSLVDERFDHDSCGVGFVATTRGVASHEIVTKALVALGRLAHRGATAADGKSSDGVGLMTGIPRALLLAEAGLALPGDQELAVGVVFLPAGETRAEAVLERCLEEQGFAVLGWRDVPVRREVLGEIALGAMPRVRQVLIGQGEAGDGRVGQGEAGDEVGGGSAVAEDGRVRQGEAGDEMGGGPAQVSEARPGAPGALAGIERRLYLARKSFERAHELGDVTGYVCSLSAQTMVYKAMCSGMLLPEFYPDLSDARFVSTFAVFHQRYATNTAPSWHRAQPARTLAHNGEINTVWGNRARMAARDATLPPECRPILTVGGTDSTSLDEAVELVAMNGRSLAEAVRMLLPPAVGTGTPSKASESTFLRYHADCVEPWDGPAAISFADGWVVGAALDRNGLRPCRYAMTEAGLVVAGSEAGLVDLDPETVVHSGRLGPGEMLVVDLVDGNVFENDELLDLFDRSAPYATLLDRVAFEPEPTVGVMASEELLGLQRGFGYTREDVKMVLAPMAADGKDSVWSMGDDAPLAFLAKSPRPVYGYFRQRFAQVTNPAIDPLREAVVVSLHTRLGPWSHMLDKNSPLAGISLPSPYLSLDQVAALRRGEFPHAEELRVRELACLFGVGETLEAGLERVCEEACELVRGGAEILLLTDRGAGVGGEKTQVQTQIALGDDKQKDDDTGKSQNLQPQVQGQPQIPFGDDNKRGNGNRRSLRDDNKGLPIPMAMATGAVHRALVRAGLRTKCGMAVEAGDCRDIHHAAILIGYGAGAVCPWLALETARVAGGEDAADTSGAAGAAERRMLKSFDAGLAKVMSKMGISVVDSYRGAHLFDILGLDKRVVETCFSGTPAPLGGIGFEAVERAVRASWGETTAAGDLPDYGWVRFRKAEGAEPHEWQPPTVRALQTAFGSTKAGVKPADVGAAFKMYSDELTSREPAVLRDLLGIRAAGAALAVEDVESVRSLQRRFVSSAMSLGSLSPEAHTCVTIAMNLLGGRSNTGEGGEDREVYRKVSPGVDGGGGPTHRDEAAMNGARVLVGVGGSAGARASASASATADPFGMTTRDPYAGLKNNRIKQVASGRFGVTAEYLAHAEEIEIKVAQGAKPGEGGQLPGHKVSGLIARLRHAQPGVSLISPPPHHDIYSIEDLAQLIYDLKRVNPRAAVGVKLVSGCGVGTVAAGVAKAYADFIVIAGNTGGTGAAALSSIKYAGNPWELGLAEAQQVLMVNGMRGRVRLRTDGGLATAQDVLIAALLGADEYAFGTAVLVSMGCDMARQCHLNTCPVGIATQRPELRAKFRGKPEHVVGFFDEIGADLRRLLARFGLASLESAVGRVDLLEQVREMGGLDLAPMLKQVAGGARSWAGGRNDQPVEHAPLDEAWVRPALAAIARGEAYSVTAAIANRDRAVGARLGGEIGLLRAQAEVRVDVTFNLAGTAGQSFGAFAVEGMRLVLEGQANDFVGKGLSGGEIVIRAMGRAARESGRHVILGNVALYGATAGSLYAAGRAGERFAVRNSGVTAVVEGVGDHGCEYMTGGTVVVLGRAGINFAAGMTGGVAWVFDEDGSFVRDVRFHPEFVDVAGYGEVETEAREGLRELVARQAEVAGSGLAAGMLTDWEEVAGRFVRLLPRAQV